MSDVPITELETCRTCGSDARDAFGVKGWCYFGQDKPYYFDTRPCPDSFHVIPKCRTCGGAKGTPERNFLDESCPDPFHAATPCEIENPGIWHRCAATQEKTPKEGRE